MSLPVWWASPLADIERLAIYLEKRQETVATGVGLRAGISAAKASAASILKEEGTGRRYRQMRFRNIPVPTPSSNNLRPTTARLSGSTISMVYECWEDTAGFVRFDSDALDRIRRADVQVCVTGSVLYGTRTIRLEDHWRVDTHHFGGVSSDPHPWIHYQRGGHAQDAFSQNPGFLPGICLEESLFDPEVELSALLQTPAPRIAAPPLDPICAVDFVLAQHSGAVWGALWANVDYAGLVRDAQKRLWEPWFSSLANAKHRRELMPFHGSPKPGAK